MCATVKVKRLLSFQFFLRKRREASVKHRGSVGVKPRKRRPCLENVGQASETSPRPRKRRPGPGNVHMDALKKLWLSCVGD
ncbi:hypothetical protein Hanom_Chr11g00990211 [Helianthus anomalus]